MSSMPERIWADGKCGYMFTKSLIVPCEEYVRADIVEAKDAEIARLRGGVVAEIQRLKHLNNNAVARIAFLEKALAQAVMFADMDVTHIVDDLDQRAGWTLECITNDVEVPNSAYDELTAYLREKKEEA